MAIWVLDAARDRGALDAFLDLPAEIYRGQPHCGAPARAALMASLLRERFRGAKRVLVAGENGRPLARIVARISPTLRDEQGRRLGLLGEFEACDRADAVRVLFTAAQAWFRHCGVETIVGPMDGDTWHRYRINTGPFDRPPFFLEPINPPYYARLWERAGFDALENFYSAHMPDVRQAMPKLGRIAGRALAHGYRLRPLQKSRLHWELKAVHEISRAIFAKSLLYTDISWEEFLTLYSGLVPLLDPELVWFADAPDGETIGFMFAYPEPRDGGTVNYKTVGVLPSHQRKGVCAALVHRTYATAAKKGLLGGNVCLVREGNSSGRLDGGCGQVFRHYRLYQYGGGHG